MLIRCALCKTKNIAVTGLASSLGRSMMLVQEQTELQEWGVHYCSLQNVKCCNFQHDTSEVNTSKLQKYVDVSIIHFQTGMQLRNTKISKQGKKNLVFLFFETSTFKTRIFCKD